MRGLLGAGAVALSSLLLWAGCAATAPTLEADRLFAQGLYPRAAAAYEALLADGRPGGEQDRLLYQAALAHALAEPSARDLERSDRLLREVAERYPRSPFGASARLILGLRRQLESQERRLAEDRERLEQAQERGEALRRQVESLAGRLSPVEEDVKAQRQAMAEFAREIERLREGNRAREERIRQLEEQIELLKAIDLGPEPPGGPGDGAAGSAADRGEAAAGRC